MTTGDDGRRSTKIITTIDRWRLADEWRARADHLDKYASRRRLYGDVRDAEDAEQAAIEYRSAADDLELFGPDAVDAERRQ